MFWLQWFKTHLEEAFPASAYLAFRCPDFNPCAQIHYTWEQPHSWSKEFLSSSFFFPTFCSLAHPEDDTPDALASYEDPTYTVSERRKTCMEFPNLMSVHAIKIEQFRYM